MEERSGDGRGLLEGLLSRWRARVAGRLIPSGRRDGRLLDIGCGYPPGFLSRQDFAERHGLDKDAPPGAGEDAGPGECRVRRFDVEAAGRLPYDDGFFDAVSMLAVLEHIRPERACLLAREVLRVLRPGGVLVLTTPAAWTDGLLRRMAGAGLLSPRQIEDHKAAYTRAGLAELLRDAGFNPAGIETGRFQGGANLWARGRK